MKYKLKEEELNQLKYLCDLELQEIIEKADNEEHLQEILQERIGEQEVIYYSNAMDFLQEEDQSLQETIELAKDMGYTIESVNSELLATILLQERMSEEIQDLIDLINS